MTSYVSTTVQPNIQSILPLDKQAPSSKPQDPVYEIITTTVQPTNDQSGKLIDACKLLISQRSLVTGKQLRKCMNEICFRVHFVQEPNYWTKKKLNKNNYVWLCKVCTEAFNNNQFCDYCRLIYYDKDFADGKTWIECDTCEKWNHYDCEVAKNDNQAQLDNEDLPYFCQKCSSKGKRST